MALVLCSVVAPKINSTAPVTTSYLHGATHTPNVDMEPCIPICNVSHMPQLYSAHPHNDAYLIASLSIRNPEKN
jgi:hypothetical protein